MKPFWVSWYQRPDKHGSFTWHGPWWISGYRLEPEAATICAAVMAKGPNHAKKLIRLAHDYKRLRVEWRFAEERPADWSPFNGRFPRAKWMQWPWPKAAKAKKPAQATK